MPAVSIDRDRLRAFLVDYNPAEPVLVDEWLAENTDPDPWGLVIDQVVGLAAVYDIEADDVRTPDQVHDLWRKVIVAVDGAGRAQAAAETTREIEGQALDALADARTEAKTYQHAADQWHLLTEALRVDLREDDVNDDDDADVWRVHVRKALWMAYGIGRRHQRDGLEYAGQYANAASARGLDYTPFDAAERS